MLFDHRRGRYAKKISFNFMQNVFCHFICQHIVFGKIDAITHTSCRNKTTQMDILIRSLFLPTLIVTIWNELQRSATELNADKCVHGLVA